MYSEIFSKERNFKEWEINGFNHQKAILLDSTESTHSLMKEIANKVPLGTVIVANTQTHGRGRHWRTWFSPYGKNLYFNILISLKDCPLNLVPQITQVSALTFAEVLKKIDSNSNTKNIIVKWPNDILFKKSKFCGILAELIYISSNGGPSTPALNLGIGINVNSTSSDYQKLNRPITTLKDIFGQELNREKLLQLLLWNLERATKQFKRFGISPWISLWKKMDSFIGKKAIVILNNRCTDDNQNEESLKKKGTILDIQEDGSLLFQYEDGTTNSILSGDLEI